MAQERRCVSDILVMFCHKLFHTFHVSYIIEFVSFLSRKAYLYFAYSIITGCKGSVNLAL